MVQKIRSTVKRWPNGWGPAHPLTGLVFCPDCGGKLYCHRVDNNVNRGVFSCGNYPLKKCDSGHRIRAEDLEQVVLKSLKAIYDYIQIDPDQFVKTVQEAVNSQQDTEVKSHRKKLAECEKRMEELEKMLCKIYEDNILGKLPDKRYEMLSKQYETEVVALESEMKLHRELVENYVDGAAGAKKFLSLISKYQDFNTLTNAMAVEFIDKILVYNRDRKGSIKSTQRVDIYFSFIGNFLPPEEPLDPEVEAALAEERAKIEADRDKKHEAYLKRKESGWQREYDERHKERRKKRMAEKQEQLPKRSVPRSEYEEYRKATRTEIDLPEALVGSM